MTIAARTRPRALMNTTAAISLVGAILLIVSLVGPTWLALFSKSDASFSDLRTATKPAAAPGVQHAYFGWLAWTLVIIVIVALAASILTAGIIRRSAAALAIVLAVVGVVLTLVCVKDTRRRRPTRKLLDPLRIDPLWRLPPRRGLGRSDRRGL